MHLVQSIQSRAGRPACYVVDEQSLLIRFSNVFSIQNFYFSMVKYIVEKCTHISCNDDAYNFNPV